MATKKKNLVIVESPAKAKTINKILKSGFLVKASYGHLRDIPRKGGINVDIDTFEAKYDIVDDPRKKKVVGELRKLAKDSDKIFLCADPDREGEAIAWHLSQILGVPQSKFERVTFNEITKKAIQEAFKHPRGIDMDLVNAQQARRVLDRLVGFKLSPLLWEKIVRGLSAGRVQSVAVRLIAEREGEIKAFDPQEYWTVHADFGAGKDQFKADLRKVQSRRVVSSAKDLEGDVDKKFHMANQKEADAVVKLASGKKYKVLSYEQKSVTDRAKPPFKTSTLQQAAANRLGFSASRTMGVAQKLYENGLITYMRTDSFNVSRDAQAAALALAALRFGKEYVPAKPNYYKSGKGAQEAHECVRPSYVDKDPASAKAEIHGDEWRLYDLIWRRFMASQMAPARYKATTCDLASEKKEIVFRATGRVVEFDGWTRVYGSGDKDNPLPVLKEGQDVPLKKASPDQHFTQPPPRFNDASLVKALEASGVGRPSTYAAIIKTILDRKYVERAGTGGKAPLKATDLGILVTESLVDHFSIMDIKFTSNMEDSLDLVESGKVDYKKLLKEFWTSFQKELKAAKKDMKSTKEGKPSDHDCPKCGSGLTERISQHGPFFKCSNDDCGEILEKDDEGNPREKEGPKKTGLKCDLCGADVVFATGRFGPYLCCEKYLNKIETKEGKKKVKTPECSFTMALTKKNEPRRKLPPTPTDMACPKCQGKIVIRVASRKKIPNAFLSCSAFPKCRHSEPLPDDMKKEGDALLATFKGLRAKDRKDQEKLAGFFEEDA